MSLADYASQSLDLGLFWNQGDQDEMYLKNMSIGRGDLKRDAQVDSHRSLTDILKNWRKDQEPETVDTEDQTRLAIQSHELKVKGFELDNRIAPGFRYTVRYIGTNEYLFDGEARRLESIGMGYGRRLTFKGDRLNFNDCYFWTDSNIDGVAFNIEAVKEGDNFTVVDSEHQQIGTVSVQSVDFPQIELGTEIKGTTVVKQVKVRFGCFVKQNNVNQHSLVNVNTQDFEMVEGVVELVKEKGCKEAIVRSVKNVYFPSLGKCTLHHYP